MRRLLPLLVLVAGCASSSELIPAAWSTVPAAGRIRSVALDAEGKVSQPPLRPLREGAIRVEGNRLFNGDKPITEPFTASDSFDFSESRQEVIFSARRDASFDI